MLEEIHITEEEAGKRLDVTLTKRFTQSRAYFQNLFEKKQVLLNGKEVKKQVCPECGDMVSVTFIAPPEHTVTPEDIPLDILYEDEWLLAVNKPAGMVVHPAPGNWSGTFVNALAFRLGWQSELNELRPGIVHRLDKETSGVMIAAKTPDVQAKLSALFAERKVEKTYVAICLGHVHDQTIDLPIGRHPKRRKEMRVDSEKGRHAVTHLHVLGRNRDFSVVSIRLETGRTHQIRVHMKHNCTPILGDATYGNPSANKAFGAKRQLLHAQKLELTHPMTGDILSIEAPIPEDINAKIPDFC